MTITTTTTASLTTIERAKGGDDLSGVALAKPEPLPYIPARGLLFPTTL
ncbi:MAG: hypothetical protein R6U13_06555 [Desulfatiglandaceae bacterium]